MNKMIVADITDHPDSLTRSHKHLSKHIKINAAKKKKYNKRKKTADALKRKTVNSSK